MENEQNPQQQPLQQDQPELPNTPILYDLAPQVDFSPKLINIKPNNELATLYPDNNNSAYLTLSLSMNLWHFKLIKPLVKLTSWNLNNPLSKLEATKSASLSKEVTESQTGHSKRKKKSGIAIDKNPHQPSASTHVVIEMHKEA
ncbi:hypothetical protein Tco_0833013 [Tanacetum coccineum]